MKLFVQIPCYNEAETIGQVIAGIPREVEGIDSVSIVVIDDGSNDSTGKIAKDDGADFVITNIRNQGLARTFRKGLDFCLSYGADIIVNLDGDNQYKGEEIPLLIAPILKKQADMVIGDRQTDSISHFSPLKKFLQRLGSATIRKLSKTDIVDTTSGFRAFSRDVAMKMTILSNYTYTIESILQINTKGFSCKQVKINTNPKTRESRLMSGIWSYLVFSIATIIRIFTMYNPLKVFISVGIGSASIGLIIGLRFVYFYFTEGGAGHIQSLLFSAILIIVGATIALVGLLADLIQFNRRVSEDILERVKKLELKSNSD